MKYTNHALARFFSRYGKEIPVDELLYIQTQIKYQFDDVTLLGKLNSGSKESSDCYYGIYDGIEYFALCAEGTERIITFYDAHFEALTHLDEEKDCDMKIKDYIRFCELLREG